MKALPLFIVYCLLVIHLDGAMHNSQPSKPMDEPIENYKLAFTKDKLPNKLRAITSDHTLAVSSKSIIDFPSKTVFSKKNYVNSALSPSNKIAVFSCGEKIVMIDLEKGKELRPPLLLERKRKDIELVLTSDSDLVIFRHYKNTLELINLNTLDVTIAHTEYPLLSAVFSPHIGRLLIAAYCSHNNTLMRCVDIVKVSNGSIRSDSRITGFPGEITSIAPCKNSSLVAITANEGFKGCADIWNIRKKKFIGSFVHDARVDSATFSPDVNILLTGCRENGGMIRLWNIRKHTPICNIALDDSEPHAPPIFLSWNSNSIVAQNLWKTCYRLNITEKKIRNILRLKKSAAQKLKTNKDEAENA